MKKMKMVTAFLFLAFLAFFADSVEAQQGQNVNEESNLPQDRSRQMTLYQTTTNTPGLMSYMGHLADAAGKPITASTSVSFSIYAAATGGTALWSETHNIIPAFTGTFGVTLGSLTPISSTLFKDNSNLYLGVKAANDVEMTPRQKISSAAFAFSAEVASPREGYGNPVSIGTANASGTAISLARSDHVHQGVRSLSRFGGSALFGDITLSAGPNANIDQTGQNLVISVPSTAFARIGKAGSPTLTGDVTLAEGTNITLSQSGQTITIGGSSTFTQGSVVFAGASGVYSQDNPNFFWDDTNNRLGIGTAGPLDSAIEINNATNSAIPNAIKITSSGNGAITRAINIADTDVVTDITLQNGESIDNDTNSQFRFKLDTNDTVTILAADTDTNTPLTISSAGTGALTLDPTGAGSVAIGSADVTGVTLTTTASSLVNVLIGNLKVGTLSEGVPDFPLNGEDAFIAGTLEVDGDTRLDGTLFINRADTTISDAIKITSSFNGAITRAINIATTAVTTDITLQNGESIDNDTNSQFRFKLDTNDTVTILAADTDTNTPLTISSAGTGVLALNPAGTGKVGIWTANPLGTLHVRTSVGTGTVTPDSDADDLVVESSGDDHAGISIISDNGLDSSIKFGSPSDVVGGFIKWNFDNINTVGTLRIGTHNTSGGLRFSTGLDSEKMRIQPDGKVGIGTTSPDGTLHVHTASAGTVTAHSDADDLVVENSAVGGISILTPDNQSSHLYFGSPTDNAGGLIAWQYNVNEIHIGTDKSGADIVFRPDTNVEKMRITDTGKVGIGTASPVDNLHIDGGATQTNLRISGSGTESQIRLHNSATGGRNWVISSTGTGSSVGEGRLSIYDETAGSPRLRIDASGNVTIGGDQTPPTVRGKLHVEGTGGTHNPTTAQYALFKKGTDDATSVDLASATDGLVSIFGSDRIVTGAEFNAFSDARIKNILGVSSGAADLNALRQIEVVDFRYKDRRKDDGPKKKVIGQQLAKVYPQAVHFMTAVVADIMRDATINGRVITLPDHSLKTGDRVKLIFEEGDVEAVCEVLAMTQDTFTVDENKQGGVFVYGREVDDFHIVDYEAIAMLNVSATQELANKLDRLEEQQKIIAAQQKQIESLQAEIKAMQKSLTSASEAVGLRK